MLETMPKPISMTFSRPESFKVRTLAYEIDVTGSHSWLRRIAWWLLKKLGAVSCYLDERWDYQQIHFDPNDAVSRIINGAQVEFARLGRKPERVMLGREDFMRFMESQCYPPYMPKIGFTGLASYGYEIYGLKVEVIPHMNGVLVL